MKDSKSEKFSDIAIGPSSFVMPLVPFITPLGPKEV